MLYINGNQPVTFYYLDAKIVIAVKLWMI